MGILQINKWNLNENPDEKFYSVCIHICSNEQRATKVKWHNVV